MSYFSSKSLFIEVLPYTSILPPRRIWTPVTYNETTVRFSSPYALQYTIVNGLILPIPFPAASLGVPPYTYSISPSNILHINDVDLTIENTQGLSNSPYIGTLMVTDAIGSTDSLPITITVV